MSDSSDRPNLRVVSRSVAGQERPHGSAGRETGPGLGEAPLMVRDLSGRIFYWNSLAEKEYGWEQTIAIGNSSHSLLQTVFPKPLDIINTELLTRGIWKGELIHTKSDGSQVKVQSRWELFRDTEGRLCTVLEVNDNFAPLYRLESAKGFGVSVVRQLRGTGRLALALLRRKVGWWLCPLLLVIGAIKLIYLFTPHTPSLFFM